MYKKQPKAFLSRLASSILNGFWSSNGDHQRLMKDYLKPKKSCKIFKVTNLHIFLLVCHFLVGIFYVAFILKSSHYINQCMSCLYARTSGTPLGFTRQKKIYKPRNPFVSAGINNTYLSLITFIYFNDTIHKTHNFQLK